MKKIISVILILGITSCGSEMKNKKKILPFNSATNLLREESNNLEITEPSTKNIDLINGFRGIKLLTNVDSLYLKDWELINFSPKIDYYENELFIWFDSILYPTDICLTFYNERLTMIDIKFDNIDVLKNNQAYSKNDIENEIIEPKMLKTFHNTFGLVKPFVEGEEIKIGPALKLDEMTIAINNMYNKKKLDVSSYSDYYMNKFPKEVFKRNLYEVVKEVYQRENNIDFYPSSTITFYNVENMKLFEYIGDENGMKLLLTNKFKIIEPEGKSYHSYKLNETMLQVKIYDIQLASEYLIDKKKKESENRVKSNLKYEKIKKSRDSLELLKSASQF